MDNLKQALKDVGINNPEEIGLTSFNDLGNPRKEIVLERKYYHNFSKRKIEKALKKSLIIFKDVM